MRLLAPITLAALLLSVSANAQTTKAPAAKPVVVTVSDLAKKASNFDKKNVQTTGKVEKFEQRTSRKGNAYFVFDLIEGKERVHIYGQGKLEVKVKDGDKLKVTGFFRKEKKIGDRSFKNEIQVDLKKKPIEVL
ncbi:hypothetical protein MCEMSE15_01529 [Fimbriimonadaceae bacterium]